jgi:hypothetical protein
MPAVTTFSGLPWPQNIWGLRELVVGAEPPTKSHGIDTGGVMLPTSLTVETKTGGLVNTPPLPSRNLIAGPLQFVIEPPPMTDETMGSVNASKKMPSQNWPCSALMSLPVTIVELMPKLLDAPLWLDPSDWHRMAAVMQIAPRPMQHDYAMVSGDRRCDLVWQELIWPTAVHRFVTEGITPEQAVDEAIEIDRETAT